MRRVMTRLYLIRHGENDFVLRGAIAGRQPGIHLNDTGHAQAERLAHELHREGIERIYSSPLERCRETAEPLARRIGVKIEPAEDRKSTRLNSSHTVISYAVFCLKK